MKYTELLNMEDVDLRKLIDNTMRIYQGIKDKKLKYKEHDKYRFNPFSEYKTKKMSDIDKKCVSLFLAGIKYNEDIYNIFKDNSDITLKKIYKYFKLPKNGYLFGNIYSYEYYYNDKFILFFSKIIRNILNNKKTINFENVFCSIKDNDVCGSNIIEHVFQYFKLESRKSYKFEHEIFDEIEELGIQRIKEKDIQKSIKTETKKENFNNIKKEKYSSKSYNEIIKFGIDLNEIEYITNPALGREKEINEMIASLLIDGSIILTGEAATGKTAIVEGLAYKIQNNDVPLEIQNLRIIKINPSTIVNGTRYRGDFEKKLEKIIDNFTNDENLILFLDEIHTTIGSGNSEGTSYDMADILKPHMDRGQIKIIGTTTTDEYEKIISNNSAFKRRFERIKVNELDNRVIKEILKDIIYKMEKTTKIKFNLDKNLILDLIIELTQNKYRVYNDKINNPDISIKILKKAFAYAVLEKNEEVKENNIQKAIESCDRIYDSVKEKYVNKLSNNDENTKNVNNQSKVIQFKLLNK